MTAVDWEALKKARLGHDTWLILCRKDIPCYRAAARDCKCQKGAPAWLELHTDPRRDELVIAICGVRQSDEARGRMTGVGGGRRPAIDWAQVKEVKEKRKEHSENIKKDRLIFYDYCDYWTNKKGTLRHTIPQAVARWKKYLADTRWPSGKKTVMLPDGARVLVDWVAVETED